MTNADSVSAARRLLLVHAHPDDEVIGTGATMAHYAAIGVHVTLVTCTLGEEGEIHVPALAELARACKALGVADHRFLGGAGRYRDSGMMGLPTNDHPRSFWQADVEEATAYLLDVMREVRPQVVITYDGNGFYGHPDHIQAHRVAMRAAELATAEGFGPEKIYWTAMPRSVLEAGMNAFIDSADNPFAGMEQVDDLPFGTPDEEIAARIDGTDQYEAKTAAMRAHASQIPENSWLFSIAGDFGGEFMGVEYFTLATGQRGAGEGPYSWESDLFSGLPVEDAQGAAAPVDAASR